MIPPDTSSIMSDGELNCLNGNFLCGVVEGFYGRPWTTEQRRKLFRRMRKMGLNTYLYAPKDDCKHRMFWRDQYSVEEADHLTSLISAAAENNVSFVYAISPGLDITFSSNKDVALLKKKLEQVASFGCKAFALLFDDIDVDMCEGDKEVFQSFAQAQVSVTNEVFQHLEQPKFLFCPTEYCASRAVPSVAASEYLNTIGSKLLPAIDIMWTGPKVISKKITIRSIEEVAKVLQRKPVIWDNIHANDYDQKRLFLGPYEGRSPDLIPHLRGVLTNPNCEFEANFIAMHTLARWCKSDTAVKQEALPSDSPLRAEFKLETEADYSSDEDMPFQLHSSYKPKQALTAAMNDWLEEIHDEYKPKTKTIQPTAVTEITVEPNTVVNSWTNNTQSAPVPVPSTGIKNLNELASLEVPDSYMQPTMSSVPVNSLVDLCPSSDSECDTASELNDPAEPMDCVVTPGSTPVSSEGVPPPPHVIEISQVDEAVDNGLSSKNKCDSSTDLMQVDSELTIASSMSQCSDVDNGQGKYSFTPEDVNLLVELFYLPFEHGSQAVKMLTDFHWLKANAHLMAESKSRGPAAKKTESMKEWQERYNELKDLITAFYTMMDNFCSIPNKPIIYDIFPYLWDLKSILSVLGTFIDWLTLGHVPYISVCYMQGNPHTWASRPYRESFTNGDLEPWVFRGGLQGEFQRLLPLDGAVDLLLPVFPMVPVPKMCNVRPFKPKDESAIYKVCLKTCDDGGDGTEQFLDHPDLIADKLIGAYLTISPEYCFAIEDDDLAIHGYVVAALDAKVFNKKAEMAWIPAMQEKYPLPDKKENLSPAEEIITTFHNHKTFMPESLLARFPSTLRLNFEVDSKADMSAPRRALAAVVAALKANGSHGVHVEVAVGDKNTIDMYKKLGLVEVQSLDNMPDDIILLGRAI